MAGPFLATVEVAGPFKFESQPYTITVDAKPLVVAAQEEPATEKMEDSVSAALTPETTLAEAQTSTSEEEQNNRGGSWIWFLVIGILAVLAAGFAICKKKAAS